MCLMLPLPYAILSIVTNILNKLMAMEREIWLTRRHSKHVLTQDCAKIAAILVVKMERLFDADNVPLKQQRGLRKGLSASEKSVMQQDFAIVALKEIMKQFIASNAERSNRKITKSMLSPKGSNMKKMVNASNAARKDTMKAIIVALTTSGVLLASMELQCLSTRRCFKNLKAQIFDASTRACLLFLVSMPA